MSSYRNLTNSPAFNIVGENKWDIKTPSYEWEAPDGAILSQSSYAKAFNKIGYIENLPAGNGIVYTTTNTVNNLNAIEFANETIIAAGANGTIIVSADGGINWTSRNSGTTNTINSLIYANNIYVYGGSNGTLATSSDTITWTLISSGTTNSINSIIYANNTFVYVGDSGTLATSPDATVWTIRTSNTTSNINDITYGDGKFLYAANNGNFARSTNSVDWESGIENLVYVGGKTISRIGNTSSSVESLTDLTGGVASAPAAGDYVFIAVATGSTAQRSQAVSGYTQISSLYSNDLEDTNLWVGYRLMGATPNTTVTIPSTGSFNDAQTVAIQVWRGVHADIFDTPSANTTGTNTILVDPPSITTRTNNSVLLVIGAGGHAGGATRSYTASYLSNFLTTSAGDTVDSVIGFGSIERPTSGAYDPAAWTYSSTDSVSNSYAAVTVALKPKSANSSFAKFDSINNLNAVVYGSNTFVLAGDSGTLATSSNTLNWVTRTSGVSNNINSLVYARDRFVFATSNGSLGVSTNAISWSTVASGTSNGINDLADGKNLYLYSANNGTVGYLTYYTYSTFTQFALPNIETFNIIDAFNNQTNSNVYIKI